jgi:hypothetical protein
MKKAFSKALFNVNEQRCLSNYDSQASQHLTILKESHKGGISSIKRAAFNFFSALHIRIHTQNIIWVISGLSSRL